MQRSDLVRGARYVYTPSGDGRPRVVVLHGVATRLGEECVLIDDTVFGYRNQAVRMEWFLARAQREVR